jgi:hypothetical protein
VVFSVDGDAEAEKLAALVQQSQKRSAVFDVLSNGNPVTSTSPAADHERPAQIGYPP